MKKEKTSDNSNTTINSRQLAILTANFPQCFDKNGDFIPHKMQEVVSKEGVNLSKESYSLNWLGKSYARLLANETPLTLLKEDAEHNQKPENENSENLLIKGDNLEVLKHLRHAYSESVKMIYIDPPYNTGNDGFVYADNRKFTTEQLSQLAGIDEDEAQRILEFTNSKSNSHSAWLTFMYPRLYVARELLSDDGVIFISIDDNEQTQLKMLCDEIFGEKNVEAYIWNLSDFTESSFTKTASHTVRVEHEYIIACYKKHKKLGKYKEYRLREREDLSNIDNDPRGKWFSGNISRNGIKSTTGSQYFTITTPTGRKYTRNWTLSKEEYIDLLNDNKIYFARNGDGVPRLKMFKNEPSFSIQNSIFNECKTSITGKNQLKKLFEDRIIFDFPKPVNLINRLLSLSVSNSKEDVVLDFFAGSGTTADAVMQFNAVDGGKRRCISVQLDESINEKKNKIAYDFVKDELEQDNPTIFDITKERILRAGAKIQKDNQASKEPKDLSKQDFGFKVFEILPMFEGFFGEMDELDEQQALFDGSQLSDDELQTLLTSWMANDGVKLTAKVEKVVLDKYTACYVDKNLYLMDKGFTTDDLKFLLEKLDSVDGDNKNFQPTKLVLFGYNFKSKHQREISEALNNYTNKKQIELDRIIRY
ncbi:adenine-specific DNA-methyltransferase [Bathymodiolus thermophilus thioautotrophic gill symbiont]|uniref:site-specific DNA-methyltransferase (adenine-specific) n=1 Tax=Bathymodiolus thermophilus thioautotrophic gill symbiont TaxID=2360 RepID=A0A3G3IMV2_9GAMM|nr:site-specific DNA-methyltransferase [Bathymodiolus thermophilus thioautotrophic gill symbiont]AYQ57121.1 adenine-specific DNA-methyltransferase [Bathymodiolus thermophilus thioautotrophic gill symbiont]